jgi:hypothetical protein
MKIGIIGAGNIGSALAKRLRSAGHDVQIANSRGSDTLAALAKETGAVAVDVRRAPQGADVVIVTIPEKNIPHLPKDVFSQVPRDYPSSTPGITTRNSGTA